MQRIGVRAHDILIAHDKFHCDSLANYKYFTNMERVGRAFIAVSAEIRNSAAIKFIG